MHPSQVPTGTANRPFGYVPGMPNQFPQQGGHALSNSGGYPPQQQQAHPGSAAQAYASAVPAAGVGVAAVPPSPSAGRPSERQLLSTASSLAQRSYNEGNYALAKRLLDSVAVSYRHEGWKSILTAALLTALDCACRLRAVQDAVQYSLELMGHGLLATPVQKQLIMQQMLNLAASPPMAPLTGEGAAGAGAQQQPPAQPAAPFDPQAFVFEVDRRHGLLAATSHFLTVPASETPVPPAAVAPSATGALVAVSTARDPFVCVGEEFDLVLSLAVALPAQADFNRIDVYFYAPPPPPPLHAHGIAAQAAPAPAATPYHLVLLPGGVASPVHDPRGSGAPSDRELPVLRPDALGQVRTDLRFPAVQVTQSGSTGAAGLLAGAGAGTGLSGTARGGGGSTVFTFGRSASGSASGADGSASGLRSTAATRTFRIRMRATQATTTSGATLSLPLASAAAAATSAPTAASSALHIPGANQALFVTTVVAALALPAPPNSGSDSGGSLQLKVDVLPSKPDESFVPSVVLEQRALERREAERKAKKKGLPLPPVADGSLDAAGAPARTPTLRILPQHARAHLRLLHPAPALLGEFYPLQICVQSDGDAIRQGELLLSAAGGSSSSTLTVGGAPGGPTLSPGLSNSPGLTPSSSADSLANMKIGGEDALLNTSSSGGVASGGGGETDEPLVKFFRLTAAGEKVVGSGAGTSQQEELFEELPSAAGSASGSTGAVVPIPDVPPYGSHVFVVFLRCGSSSSALGFSSASTTCTPTVSLGLTYTNGQTQAGGAPEVLGVTSVMSSLSFRTPFKVKTKIFSDALSGLAPLPSAAAAPQAQTTAAVASPPAGPLAGAGAVPGAPAVGAVVSQAQAQAPQRLILHQPVLLHVEVENVSGAVLRIDELGLDLSTKFFRNTSKLLQPAAAVQAGATGTSANGLVKLRPCVSPAAKDALLDAARHASPASSSSNDVAAVVVALAPGEKYTHLFSFVPQLPGKTRFAPLHIRWNRASCCVQQPPPPPLLPVPAPAPMVDVGLNDEKESSTAASAPSPSSLSPSPPAPLSPPSLPPLLFPTRPVSYRKDLLYFHILKAPLGVSLEFPPACTLGDSFEYTLSIRNQTDQMHDVQLALLEGAGAGGAATAGDGAASAGTGAAAGRAAVGAAGAAPGGHASAAGLVKCVLSGRTRGLLRVRPHSTYRVAYRVCPLECGALSLPRIQLAAAGLTTLAHVVPSTTGGGSVAVASPAASVLLMDPNDVGVVFVHPREKTAPALQHSSEASTDAAPLQPQIPPALPPRLR